MMTHPRRYFRQSALVFLSLTKIVLDHAEGEICIEIFDKQHEVT
jgi:hypothetical protein